MDAKKIKIIRCIELAKNGFGNTLGNPMVGALIAIDDRIIGEGYHRKYGGAHAEVNAINAVSDTLLLKLSTIYVNLEPCSHFGKTPPCADLIIEKQIPRVVIGMLDPFAKVAGQGIEKLRNAGVNVEVGVMETECRELNKRFITFHEKRRPYIILKWAETSDGYIDIDRNEQSAQQPNWITDDLARQLVHKWRMEEQAILIGTNTALFDNPKLTVRDWHGKNPIRMVVDKNEKLSNDLAVFDNSATTIFFSGNNSCQKNNLTFENAQFGKDFPKWFCDYCYNSQINSVIVEGGATLLQYFINAGLWDEARVFKGDISFGSGLSAPAIETLPYVEERLRNSVLKLFLNK